MTKLLNYQKSPFKYVYYLLSLYFYIRITDQLLKLFVGIDLYLFQLYSLFSFALAFAIIKYVRHHTWFDNLFIVYIIYLCLANVFTESYSNQGLLLYKAFLNKLCFMGFYVFGKFTVIDKNLFWKKLKVPIITAAIFGFIFYFFPPGFYVSMKSTTLNDPSNLDAYYEIFRLSSFWSHAYTLAYALTIFLIYYFDYVMQKGWTLKNVSLIIFLFTVLVFAQMRVCIFSALLSFAFLYFYHTKTNNKTSRKKNYVFLLLIVAISIFIYNYAIEKLDADQIEYITKHMLGIFDDDKNVERTDHVLRNINKTPNLFGYGLGRYSIFARDILNMPSIVDQGYYEILFESGYVGLTLFISLLFFTFVKAVKNISMYRIELCILCFFILNLYGACSISDITTTPMALWLAMGIIWSDRCGRIMSIHKILQIVYRLKRLKNESNTYRIRAWKSDAFLLRVSRNEKDEP